MTVQVEDIGKEIERLLQELQTEPSNTDAWRRLALAYRAAGDHSHQVWAWSRAVKHTSTNRHCRKWGHLLRFQGSPDRAICLYCGELFVLEG